MAESGEVIAHALDERVHQRFVDFVQLAGLPIITSAEQSARIQLV